MIKDKKRIIHKLVCSALLAAGIAGIGVGSYLANDAFDDDKNTSQQSTEYIVGLTAATTGCAFASVGASSLLLPIKTKIEKRKEEYEDKFEM